MKKINFPKTTLTTGINIVNFSSPHKFYFDDGSTLGGVDPDTCRLLSIERKTEERPSECGKFIDCSVSFQMTDAAQEQIDFLNADPDIDIILVSLPVLTAIKAAGYSIGKCRVCLLADRVEKRIYHNKFSI